MEKRNLKTRLAVLVFLEYAVWGAYLTSIGRYLGKPEVGLGPQVKWFFAMQGIVSLFMPTLIGILADRKIQPQKLLSLCHLLAGGFMAAAGLYCMIAGGSGIRFLPLFALYSCSLAFFMPTISLVNSTSYSALGSIGLDPVKEFPPIRTFGTIGFIISMLATNWIKFDGVAMQDSYTQLFSSAILSAMICIYALSIPHAAASAGQNGASAGSNGASTGSSASGGSSNASAFKAFALFKDRQFAVFFVFSALLGAALQITNGYANMFLGSFSQDPVYADAFAVRNSNALLAISQASETLCILLIPFFMKRFGIKKVMLISMLAWVLRFALFGLGSPAMPGVLLYILSCIVYGVAFDFFNISGSLYVNQNAPANIRASAQGMFMLMTNGFGASVGTLAAGAVMDAVVFKADAPSWSTAWYIFAAYALVVAICFMILFKENRNENSHN